MCHTWQGMQQSQLQPLWQAGGEALHVQLWRVAALRLQKDLQRVQGVVRSAQKGIKKCRFIRHVSASLQRVVMLDEV